MTKKKAREILLVHACCSFTNVSNNLCIKCPWNRKKDCIDSTINEEIIMEAIRTLEGENNVRMIKLSEIKIQECFAETTPSEEKMEECKEHWNLYHKQDRYVVVDHDNTLIDGYVQYLVLKENNIEDVEVKISHCRKKRWHRKNLNFTPRYRENPTTYIYGVHPNSKDTKTYMWRVPESWTSWAENIQIGDTIMCATKNGYAPVVVSKIEILDKCPIDIPVKKVCKKEIRRDGMVVEL